MFVGVLKRAIETAEKSNYYPFRVGAVLFKGNKIFVDGRNSIRCCKNLKKKNWNSVHAEQHAILNMGEENCKGLSLLVIRLNLSNNIRLAKPCEMCEDFIRQVGIKRVYYSNNDGTISKMEM